MKIAKEIVKALCEPAREQDIPDMEAIVAAKLEPVRVALKDMVEMDYRMSPDELNARHDAGRKALALLFEEAS